MSSRSIVDRVLLSAAAVCAAGLVWQLTVLMTSRGHAPAFRSIETVSTASAQAAAGLPPPSPATPAIRVVYPDTGAPKVVAKATDTPDGAPVAALAPSAATPAVLKVATASSQSAAPSVPAQPAAVPPAAASAASRPADVAALAPSAQAPVAQALAAQPPATESPSSAATDEPKPSSGQGVNINRASVDELNRLPGAGRIGQAIASHRPYRSVEDLLKKRVVRRSIYDQIKNQLAAD